MKDKVFNLLKPILFISLGILILIFNDVCVSYINVTIAIVMALYGAFYLFKIFNGGHIKEHISSISYGLVLILLGIVLFTALKDNLPAVAIVWAVWSILREAKEISELIHDYKSWIIRIISGAESIFLVVISVELLITPSLEHVIFHTYVLGIELILEILFPLLETVLTYKKEKKEIGNNH